MVGKKELTEEEYADFEVSFSVTPHRHKVNPYFTYTVRVLSSGGEASTPRKIPTAIQITME